MELQQSPPYLEYIKKLHWNIETIDSDHIFYRRLPLIGTFAKMQRINQLPDIEKFLNFLTTHRVKRLVLESGEHLSGQKFYEWARKIEKYVSIEQSPYIPSKTRIVDLTLTEDTIFGTFSEAKRRGVRRAMKNNLVVEVSQKISDMIAIKAKSAGIFGFITTSGMKELWESFGPKHTAIVLCYLSHTSKKELIGGVFLVYWEQTAYYWIAGATKKGKKLAVPTLLAWEAMKIAKNNGMEKFDFVGVWDERFPRDNKEWLGFTKFKEGFGGKAIYYPTHRVKP